MDSREQTLKKLNYVRDIYSRCKPIENELNAIAVYKKNTRAPSLAGSWIALVASGGGTAIGFFPLLMDDAVAGAIACLIIGLALLGAGFYLYSQKKNKLPEMTRLYNEEMNKASQREAVLVEQLQSTLSESHIDAIFPINYFYAEAIDFCIYAVQSFRANDIKEALNLYEADRFQRNMLAMQQQQLNLQQQQLSVQQQIQRDAAGARKAATVGAVMGGITAYNVRSINKKL